jgi:hypothetical protein
MRCILCRGELDVIGSNNFVKLTKCQKCGAQLTNNSSEHSMYEEPHNRRKPRFVKDISIQSTRRMRYVEVK